MANDAKTTVRTVLITPADPQDHPVLVLELEIDCALCGQLELQLLGHHLRMLHRVLGKVIEAHPDLCGTGGQEIAGSRMEFSGVVDPRKVSEN